MLSNFGSCSATSSISVSTVCFAIVAFSSTTAFRCFLSRLGVALRTSAKSPWVAAIFRSILACSFLESFRNSSGIRTLPSFKAVTTKPIGVCTMFTFLSAAFLPSSSNEASRWSAKSCSIACRRFWYSSDSNSAGMAEARSLITWFMAALKRGPTPLGNAIAIGLCGA